MLRHSIQRILTSWNSSSSIWRNRPLMYETYLTNCSFSIIKGTNFLKAFSHSPLLLPVILPNYFKVWRHIILVWRSNDLILRAKKVTSEKIKSELFLFKNPKRFGIPARTWCNSGWLYIVAFNSIKPIKNWWAIWWYWGRAISCSRKFMATFCLE